jgi:hypothetical protein
VKINAEHALAAPSTHGDMLSAADVDESEWEMMYPHFLQEGLVDRSDCVKKKMFNVLYL